MLDDFDPANVFISILNDIEQSIPQLKIQIFWNITTCRLVNSYRGFMPPSSGSGCTLFFENFNNLTMRTVTSLETMLIKIQPDATVCRYLFTAKLLYMFRVSQHPSSGVLKTLTAASGTGHNTGTATSLQRGPNGPRWREVAGMGRCRILGSRMPQV